jgi:chromosome segregation ATPase
MQPSNSISADLFHTGGKSAVLTAITVALGGKANFTGRGSGLKSFIREGQRSGYQPITVSADSIDLFPSISEVTVTLKNDGDDAYKPDIFGKRIIITRRFTAQGASSYKILSDKKVMVSNKKADLDDICDHMSIQVENPLNVLTQGSSFLTHGRHNLTAVPRAQTRPGTYKIPTVANLG